jgi:exosome complex RNA-binding protein Rrp42 (RNase PH superfamily)
MAGVQASVGTPYELAPEAGQLQVNVHMTPVASSDFPVGRPGDEAMALSQWLTRTANKAGMMDLNSLCISSGKAVWVLTVDVVVLAFDGNVADAALIALVAAVADTRLPATRVDDLGVVTMMASPVSAVSMGGVLCPLSAVRVAGDWVTDPTKAEEGVGDCHVTVLVGEGGGIAGSHVWKSDAKGLKLGDMRLLHTHAVARVTQVASAVRRIRKGTEESARTSQVAAADTDMATS